VSVPPLEPFTLTIDVHLDAADLRAALARDVRSGLCAARKSLPPTWFYDERGSTLFEEITRLPEYYPTRAERVLLERHAGDVVALTRCDTLVELGAGACEKTRVLLDALAHLGSLRQYVPFDVSADFLEDAATSLGRDYEGLHVHAVVGDFHHHLEKIPGRGERLIAFLGGTIGNLVPWQRRRFFSALRATMGPSDHLLLGADLVKDVGTILAAYDDSEGVTGRFNRNVLHVINRELDADFVPDRFAHVVRWDSERQWIEMRLRSHDDQTVHIGALGLTVPFSQDEELLTEISAKFTPTGIRSELVRAGFVLDGQWGADAGEFLLTLAHPASRR
jgi:L-histidine N-alpha-methyltransferase